MLLDVEIGGKNTHSSPFVEWKYSSSIDNIIRILFIYVLFVLFYMVFIIMPNYAINCINNVELSFLSYKTIFLRNSGKIKGCNIEEIFAIVNGVL